MASDAHTPAQLPPVHDPARELMSGLFRDADTLAARGIADPADIDLCMRLGAGHPRGPFAARGLDTDPPGAGTEVPTETWSGAVGLAGAGHMAAGIAEAVARSGRDVRVWARSDASAQRLVATVTRSLTRQVTRGRLSEDAAAETLARLDPVLDPAGLRAVDVVVEAVTEDLGVKTAVLGELDRHLPASVVVATNTSSFRVADLLPAVTPQRPVLALHFFNPAAVMELVEVVVPAVVTVAHPGLAATAHAWVRDLGKTPVSCGDSRGFVVNRLLIPFLNDAVARHAEGAPVAEVDALLVEGAAHPMGPLALVDLIGVDVTIAALDSMAEAEPDPRLRPHPLLRRMAAAGDLGRKSGRGFYVHS